MKIPQPSQQTARESNRFHKSICDCRTSEPHKDTKDCVAIRIVIEEKST